LLRKRQERNGAWLLGDEAHAPLRPRSPA
jgi:hypothetical protein